MRRLTQLTETTNHPPRGRGPGGGSAFRSAPLLHLPTNADEWWALHRSRTEASIAHVNHMLTDPVDANDVVLAKMLADDTLRPTQMPAAPV